MDGVWGFVNWIADGLGSVVSFLSDPIRAAAISAFAAAVAAGISAIQGFIARRSTELTDHYGRTQLLLNVTDRWTAVLPVRYRVRQKTYDNVQSYGSVDKFLASEDWQLARQVCNFYEFVGLLVYHRMLRVSTLLVFVTVDPADFERLRPAITYLRENYRSDIYLFWDYLLSETKGHKAHNPFRDSRPRSI
jgi:hypothetical protein